MLNFVLSQWRRLRWANKPVYFSGYLVSRQGALCMQAAFHQSPVRRSVLSQKPCESIFYQNLFMDCHNSRFIPELNFRAIAVTILLTLLLSGKTQAKVSSDHQQTIEIAKSNGLVTLVLIRYLTTEKLVHHYVVIEIVRDTEWTCMRRTQ